MPDWLDRYRAGQRSQVWHELRQLGSAVREPGLREQAQLVCDEMARRARRNVEIIIERLTGAGYRFRTSDYAQDPVTPHIPPSAVAAAHAGWLAGRLGPVPMTLLSWIRLAGDVWLAGTHPQWPESASADPLVIEAEGSRYPSDPDPRLLRRRPRHVAPMGRAGPGTGRAVRPPALAGPGAQGERQRRRAPYGLILPDGCADGLFAGETTMPFVSYLNHVFSHGGFPGQTLPHNHWQRKQALAKDLLPLEPRAKSGTEVTASSPSAPGLRHERVFGGVVR